jgi:hypothetical protein
VPPCLANSTWLVAWKDRMQLRHLSRILWNTSSDSRSSRYATGKRPASFNNFNGEPATINPSDLAQGLCGGSMQMRQRLPCKEADKSPDREPHDKIRSMADQPLDLKRGSHCSHSMATIPNLCSFRSSGQTRLLHGGRERILDGLVIDGNCLNFCLTFEEEIDRWKWKWSHS